jgi:hypothetical protein
MTMLSSASNVRQKLRDGVAAAPYKVFTHWPDCTISDVGSPRLSHIVGRRPAELPEFGSDLGLVIFRPWLLGPSAVTSCGLRW